MSTTLKSVLERVVGTLENDDLTTWTLQDLVRYGNDGARDMHVRRPDLFNVEQELTLVAGARQTLPAAGSKLINITHNTVGDKRAVTPVSRPLLDAQVPGWRSQSESLEIEHFMYDERQPKVFETYPPAKVGAKVQIEFASIPVDMPIPAAGVLLAALTGDVNVPDLQTVTLQHYICARCYAEGSEAGNMNQAQAFLSRYASDLGVEIQATKAVAPTPTSA
jgi:hypothetical protein